MADEVSTNRKMKYPYTWTAKIAQFPYKHYYENSWAFRYWLYGVVVCAPMFYMLQKMSYSKENVEKWAEIRRKQFSGETHH